MKRITVLISVIIFIQIPLFSQGEANNWYFPIFNGLSFNSEVPTILLDGAMYGWEGCSTISDRNGNLLFYTDGYYIWNRDHELMKNGKWIGGGKSSTQSALIAQKPKSKNLYYVFTTNCEECYYDNYHDYMSKGFQFNVVDMNLENGFGAVTNEKNIIIMDTVSERLAGTKHRNGIDDWIIIHEWNTNAFRAYLLTENGFNKIPIISKVGSIHLQDHPLYELNENMTGYLKMSSNNKFLAVAIAGLSKVEIFHFNDSSGLISNPISIVFPSYEKPYGIEFSPNCKFLYVSTWPNFFENYPSLIRQFDMSVWDSSSIKSSEYIIATSPPKLGFNFFASMQLAPDGEIFISDEEREYIAQIENPNRKGLLCNFKDSVYHFPKNLRLGLPNFLSSYFKEGLQVWLPDTNSIAGKENFCIPLNAKLKLDTNLMDSKKYKITISFAADLFYPDENSKISDSKIINGRRVLTIEGDTILKSYRQICLTNICGTTLLGDSLLTDLKIENVILEDFDTEKDILNGSLEIEEVCKSNLRKIQLIRSFDYYISSNIVNNYLEINFPKNIASDSLISVHDFNIFTLLGVKIPRPEFQITKDGKIMIDVSGLPSEVYFVRVGDRVSKFIKI